MVVAVGVVKHRPDYHHILFTVSFSACGYWFVLHSKGLQGFQESCAGEEENAGLPSPAAALLHWP